MPHWIVAPPTSSEQNGSTLTATALKGSDFWRKTHYGFIRHSGHLFAQVVEGDFTARVTFTGNYANEYDQAGLMVMLDETTWIKTGIEFTEGHYFASAVVTRDYSDWSVAPLSASFGGTLTIQMKRKGGSFEIHYREAAASPWTLLRITHLTEVRTLQIGRMLCAPSGDGFTANFTDFSVVSKVD